MCTALMISDRNNCYYKGRTLEFSIQIETTLTFIPRGSAVRSIAPDGSAAMTFKTLYPILGMAKLAAPTSNQTSIVDGVNDQGLSFSSNQQNNAKGPVVGSDKKNILAVTDFGTWILGNFSNVQQVKVALAGSTQIWLPAVADFGGVPVPQHYGIWDRTGDSVVVEFMNRQQNVYDNPVGVLTNGPEFPWHLTNLSNYTFNNVDQNRAKYGKLTVTTDDAGIALANLPSAQTAAGRFVKAEFYSSYVRKAETPDQAIQTLGHVMNNFDRPYDLTVDVGPGVGDGPRGEGSSSEVTEWTVMNDLSRNFYYVRSINSLNWSVIDLNRLKDVAQSKSVSSYEVNQLGCDVTRYFIT